MVTRTAPLGVFFIREIFDRGSRTGFCSCALEEAYHLPQMWRRVSTILTNVKGRGIISSSIVEEGVKSSSMAILTMLTSLKIVTNCDNFDQL